MIPPSRCSCSARTWGRRAGRHRAICLSSLVYDDRRFPSAQFVRLLVVQAAPAAEQTSTSASAPAAASTAGSDSIVAAVEKVNPAVVTITTTVTSGTGRRAVSGTGVGSGVIYTTSGYIVTNAHVVEGSTALTVTLNDGREVTGTVVTSDPAADLAIVKISATGTDGRVDRIGFEPQGRADRDRDRQSAG